MPGTFSRLLNRLTGGHAGQSLCARIAHGFGPRCLFCRFIARALRDPAHCQAELDWWLFK